MSEQFLYFLQQMFNGVTLGSTYALIAIGYTMVYGIIGMINFAHGEVYMIGSYVSFMIIAALMMMGIDTSWLLVRRIYRRDYYCQRLRLEYRASRLPACAQFQAPDRPDFRHRDVHLSAKLRQPDGRFARRGVTQPV